MPNGGSLRRSCLVVWKTELEGIPFKCMCNDKGRESDSIYTPEKAHGGELVRKRGPRTPEKSGFIASANACREKGRISIPKGEVKST